MSKNKIKFQIVFWVVVLLIISNSCPILSFAKDGTLKWIFETEYFVRSSPAIGSDGTIYVGSSDNSLYAINPDGTQKWVFETGGRVRSSPAIGSDGTIYVGSWDHNFYAINPNGTQKWMFEAGVAIDESPAIGSDGTIYVGSGDHNFYAINPDGTQKWVFDKADGIVSSAAIGADGTIYVGGYDGKIYAINPDGTQKWSYQTGREIVSSPAIDSDGTIYIGSYDYNLYAINSSSGGLANSPWPMFQQNLKHTGRVSGGAWETAYNTLFDSSSDLELLRQYRDEFLSKTTKGEMYKNFLYRSSEGALEVLLNNPELMLQARYLIDANKTAVSEVLSDNQGVIYNTDEITSFLDAYAKKSPLGLKILASMVKRDMLRKENQGKLFLGFKLR